MVSAYDRVKAMGEEVMRELNRKRLRVVRRTNRLEAPSERGFKLKKVEAFLSIRTVSREKPDTSIRRRLLRRGSVKDRRQT